MNILHRSEDLHLLLRLLYRSHSFEDSRGQFLVVLRQEIFLVLPVWITDADVGEGWEELVEESFSKEIS